MLWSTKCDSSVAFLSFPDHTAAYGKPKCSAFPSSDWIFRNGEQLIASTVVLPIPMLLPLWISFWRSYRRLIYPTESILTAVLRAHLNSGSLKLRLYFVDAINRNKHYIFQVCYPKKTEKPTEVSVQLTTDRACHHTMYCQVSACCHQFKSWRSFRTRLYRVLRSTSLTVQNRSFEAMF